MGFLGLGVSNLCSYQAMQLVGVATSTVLLYTGPVFVGIASALLYGEPLDGQRCVAFALNLFGSFLVVTNGDVSGMSFDVFGVALGVFAALINVVYVLGGKHLAGAHDPRVLVCYAFLFAFIGLLPIGFPFRDVTRVAGLELASWRIEQPQAFLQIHQPDTGTTFILIRAFREIAIHNSTNYLRPLLMDIQMDERRLIIAHPMLKRILDQGDKQQGGDQGSRGGSDDIRFQLHMFGQAYTHQLHIITKEVEILLQWDKRLATLIQDIRSSNRCTSI